MKREKLITPPAGPCVTLDELKNHLKITHDDEDSELAIYLQAAEDSCQSYTGLQAMKATYARFFDEWCTRLVFWDRNPVLEVVSVQYMPSGSTTYTTLATTDYYNDLNAEPAAVVIKNMPSLEAHPEAIKITFTSGYSDSADATTQREAVPAGLKNAILLQAGHWYMYRTDYAQKELMPASEKLLIPMKVAWV